MFDHELSGIVLHSAIHVHKQLGPGLLESTYRQCLSHYLHLQGLSVVQERAVPVVFEGIKLECGYRMDLLVEGQLLVECKSIEALAPIHTAQVLTYLRLSQLRFGLLINFNVSRLVDGVKRVVNGY
jgi:GxxExxY protein